MAFIFIKAIQGRWRRWYRWSQAGAAQMRPQGAQDLPNIILPRKAVGELRKLLDDEEGEVNVRLSETRAEFSLVRCV